MLFPDLSLWLRVLLAIAVALAISFGTTPIVKVFAQKVGAMDVPDHKRHIHEHPTPRMGGMAIFLGFLISVLLFVEISTEVRGILIGAVIIVAVGVVDDIVSLRYWMKLIGQVLAAGIAALVAGIVSILKTRKKNKTLKLQEEGWAHGD